MTSALEAADLRSLGADLMTGTGPREQRNSFSCDNLSDETLIGCLVGDFLILNGVVLAL